MDWKNIVSLVWMVASFIWIIDDAFFKQRRLKKQWLKLSEAYMQKAMERMVAADITVIPDSQRYKLKDGPEVDQ